MSSKNNGEGSSSSKAFKAGGTKLTASEAAKEAEASMVQAAGDLTSSVLGAVPIIGSTLRAGASAFLPHHNGSLYQDMMTLAKEAAKTDLVEDFHSLEGLGLMNSSIYRGIFFKTTEGMSGDAVFMVVALCTAVKSKKRILDALNYREDFKTKAWYSPVVSYFNTKTTAFVTKDRTKMPIVKIPESLPCIAALAWIKMTKVKTPERFLQNLWAAQFDLTPELQEIQKGWEIGFWNDTVKSSTRGDRPGGIKLEFHEDFYRNKASDTYPLISPSGNIIKPSSAAGYTKEDIQKFIDKLK